MNQKKTIKFKIINEKKNTKRKQNQKRRKSKKKNSINYYPLIKIQNYLQYKYRIL